MKTKLVKPSKNMLFGNIESEKKVNRFTKLVKNPLGQFVLMGIILCVLAFLSYYKVLSPSLVLTLSNLVIYSTISIGFCLLLGYSGLASLGTAGFAGIGVCCTFFIMQKLHMGFFASIVLTTIVAIGIGSIVGFISLRIEGMYLAILTLGLAEILFLIFPALIGGTEIKIGLGNITFISIPNIYALKFMLHDEFKCVVCVGLLVVLLILTNNLINSPTGRAMLAMKNSTSAAQAMGISLLKYRLLAFVISIVYAALGGMLYIMVNTNVPTSGTLLSLSFSLNVLGAVIIGGSRSLWGTMVGTAVIFSMQTLILDKIPVIKDIPGLMGIVSGVLIVLVVMFYPGGLTQLFYEIKTKLKTLKTKRRAKKYGNF